VLASKIDYYYYAGGMYSKTENKPNEVTNIGLDVPERPAQAV
jgi:hypothetical protein